MPPALEGETRPELLRQLDFYQIPWLRKIDRRVPRDLERIVAKAIEHRAADRYATAGEMARDLERFLASEPVQATERAGCCLFIAGCSGTDWLRHWLQSQSS